MKATDLEENPVKGAKKQLGKAKKALSKATGKKEPTVKPKVDPNQWDDEDGNLRPGVKVKYGNNEYEWTGHAWQNTKTNKRLSANSGAHHQIMRGVGRKPNGEKLPEYSNVLAKALAWWRGEHGDFGIAARQERGLAKLSGLVGAAIDRLNDPDDDNLETNTPADQQNHNSDTLSESGSVEGVGLIHLSEIEPTIAYLENKLGMDIANNVLGSVGKKTWSGDIDVAVNAEKYDISELIDKLNNTPGVEKVQRLAGNNITSRVKIQQYDDTIENDDGRPRTGYVQVDFMVGDPSWLKTYNHSPAQGESRYKGAMRTIMLGTIASHYGHQESKERLPDGRPLKVLRYKLGSNGLHLIERTPKPRRDGQGYTKGHIDEIKQTWRDPAEVVRVLDLGSEDALNSFESLLKAIENRYDPETVEKIKEDMRTNSTVRKLGVPEELEH